MLNIGSYMGGVDLWQNDHEHDDDFKLQSMHDKMLEVVCISGAWHLGKLQVDNFLHYLVYVYMCSVYFAYGLILALCIFCILFFILVSFSRVSLKPHNVCFIVVKFNIN